MSFGAKRECARLREELAVVSAQLSKCREERDALLKAFNKLKATLKDLYVQMDL